MITEKRLQKMIDDALRTKMVAPQGPPIKMSEGVYLVAYEARDPRWVFVPDSSKRGRFCRVPRAYLVKGCVACGALPGQPCIGMKSSSWSGLSGHADRTYSGDLAGGHWRRGKNVPQYMKKLDDHIQEQALVGLARIVLSEGVHVNISHLAGCGKKKKKPCDCGAEAKLAAVQKIIQHLPNLEEV